ncbi:hypothetical protein [Enterococcus sp. RIT-PI-f]|uniref:DUF7006 family protein n=1 Tax=Enterococcus sp. RIT-PI-f TaxID=1690244 RepID=UPI0035659A42
MLFMNNCDYFTYFEEQLNILPKRTILLEKYIKEQFNKFDELVKSISNDNFWSVFPQILGIDARLNIVIELVSAGEFTDGEIIWVAEKDYLNYAKELCGYNLVMEVKHSLIFNVG